MKIAVFSSITSNYIPNARILAESVALHHPSWDVFLLFNDRTPESIRWEDEPFKEVVFSEWLDIERAWSRFAYGYSVVEFCTATKGSMAKYLLKTRGYDAVVYLDPDTRVFSEMTELDQLLTCSSVNVVLTPHLTDAEDSDEGIWSHEVAALKHGVFNLGFFCIKNTAGGFRFLDWWERRLLDYSHIDFNYGTFTDQKWANLAPYLFDGIHVLCDRAYNVATWNIKNRMITKDENSRWLVNGQLLRFYHFSGFGSNFAWADRELEYFASTGSDVVNLWDEYKDLYYSRKLSHPVPPWKWSCTRSGDTITAEMRASIAEDSTIDPFDLSIWR